MMKKTLLILTAMLLLVGLLAAGCGSGNSAEAQKVLDKALSNMKKWTSLKVTMKATTTSSAKSSSTNSAASNSSAVVEVTTEGGLKMHTVMDYSGTKVEQYQIGDTTYAYMEGQGWAKQQSTSTSPLNVEIANALEKGDIKDLQIQSEDSKSYTLSFTMLTEAESSSSATSSATTKKTETKFVVKVDKPTGNITELKVSASSGSGSSAQKQTQVYAFSNINEPITITLPEEAKSAKSATEMQGSTPQQ
jgi:hypothetical protein